MGKEYRVAICDDQPQALAELSRIILEIGKEKGWQLTVNTYMDGEDLLQDIQELDVVFLDMEMPKEDGIGIGKKIRFYKPDCIIIMESGFVDRFKEAFTIGAQRYITKPYCTEELCEALGSVLHAKPGMAEMELYYHRNRYTVSQRDIRYVEAVNGYTEYYTDKRCYRKEISLQDAESFMDQELFVKVNRQLMVNLRYITEKPQHKFYCGEMPLVISRRLRKGFEQRYIEYDLKYGR